MSDHENTMRQFMAVAAVLDELLPMIHGHESQCLRSRGMVLAAALGMKSIGAKPQSETMMPAEPVNRKKAITPPDDLPL